jgi:hypothetical protein
MVAVLKHKLSQQLVPVANRNSLDIPGKDRAMHSGVLIPVHISYHTACDAPDAIIGGLEMCHHLQ